MPHVTAYKNSSDQADFWKMPEICGTSCFVEAIPNSISTYILGSFFRIYAGFWQD